MSEYTKIYLSGPMSHIPYFNIPFFDKEAKRLRGRCFEVVSPAELDDPRFRDLCLECPDGSLDELHELCVAADVPQATWGELLARDVRLLSDGGIEAVFLLPGWEKSRGARLESFVAILNDIPLYEEGVADEFQRVSPVDWQIRTAPAEGDSKVVSHYQPTESLPLPPGFETVVTDPDTGGQKGEKPQAFNLLPWKELGEVAKLYRAGLVKYSAHNWRKGYAWHLSFDSLIRHATQWWEGESLDSETGCSHLASVVFHALALMHFETAHPSKDDRPNV